MKAIRISLLLALTVLVFGCSKDPLTSGTVVDKSFTPAHSESYVQQIYTGQSCVANGSTRICTPQYIYTTQTRHVPDDWDIKIKACGVEAKVDDGSCREEWIDVDEKTFDGYEVNMHYPDLR